MPERLKALLIVLVVLVLGVSGSQVIFDRDAGMGRAEDRGEKLAFQSLEQVDGKVLAWIPYWDQAAAVASYKKQAEQIDFIGVFWHALLRDGTIGKYPYAQVDRELIKYAQGQGTKVLAVIANLPTEDERGDWDAARVELVIASPESRERHIADIVALVKEYNFDGVNIDYEALAGRQRDNFTRFIKELAAALHAENKILGVSLHAKFEEGNRGYENGSQAQDWAALAQAADQLYVMTYEQHWETSGPGAIAGREWIQPILEFARQEIPQTKLFAGLPLYGYDWPPMGPAEGLTHEKVIARLRQYGAQPKWDAAAGEWYFFYNDEAGGRHEVWYQDAATVAAKVKIFEEQLIPNVALWRIGGEDPAIWQHLP